MIHSELGASSAERWLNCPGSVAMVRGIPDTPSEYALEGRAAHKLAEKSLTGKMPPEVWLDCEIGGFTVNDEMVEAIEVFVRTVLDEAKEFEHLGVELLIEQRFDLSPLSPSAPMFGTSDATVFRPHERRLIIFDLKYGRGVTVSAQDNPQLMYYALGALLQFEQTHGAGQVEKIRMVIVQPRASHPDGIVRDSTISYEDLIAFAIELLERARATLAPDAPLVPGDWCRFCRAAPVCPALKQRATEVAKVEFGNLPADVPPSPETLPIEVLADVLDNADILEDWLRAVRGYVKGMLERGEGVPGWKLVPKRANRKWVEEEQAAGFALEQGLSKGDVYETKIRSVAQMEKALKRAKLTLPEDLYEKKSSGTTLAPDADPRPAAPVTTAAEAFAALPPGPGEQS